MKKILKASGINGEFIGQVEIIFNAERRKKEVHNRGTHEEEHVSYYVHKIKGVAGGKELPEIETDRESEVVELAENMERQVMHLLKWQAETEKPQTPVEILKSKGYL